MSNYKISYLLPYIFTVFIACNRKTPENVIASVGDSFISIEEFKETYINVILYTDKVDSPELRREHARFLARRKLFACAAKKEGIQLDSVSLQIIRKTEEKTLRKIYFENTIASQITEPNDSLLRKHFIWMNSEVRVRHIFSPEKNEIDSVYRIIRQDPDRFSEIALSLFKNRNLAETGGDLKWIEYNRMDPVFEEVAYSTPIDSISTPFRSAYGWHILQKINERSQVLLSEEDYQREKKWLQQQVIKKQQQILADRYVNKMMTSENIDIKEDVFYFVANEIHRILHSDKTPPVQRKLSIEEVKNINLSLVNVKNAELVTFNGGHWYVKDFISRLDEIQPDILYSDLITGLYRVLRDYFLVQKAKDAGLLKDETVLISRKDAEDLQYSSLFLANHIHSGYNKNDNMIIKSEDLNYLADSLSQIFPITYNYSVIDTLFE